MPYGRLTVLLLCLLGAGLRFWQIGDKSIWIDEAFSLWMAGHEPLQLIDWLIKIDQHPPLYYLLLRVWIEAFGDWQGVTRSLSALAGSLTLPVVYVAARHADGDRGALITLGLLALSPFHVRFAQEARMYALLTLWIAGVLFFLFRILLSKSARLQEWLGLSLCQALAMLTQNTVVLFLTPALNACLILHARREKGWLQRNRRYWILSQALAALLWLPWAYPFYLQSRGVVERFWVPYPSLGSLWQIFTGFHLDPALGDSPGYWAHIGFVAFLALYGMSRLRRPSSAHITLVLLFLVPLVVGLLVSPLRPTLTERTLSWITLPYFMLVGSSASRLMPQQTAEFSDRRRGALLLWLVWMGIALSIFLTTSHSLRAYYSSFQKEAWDRAANLVAQESTPGDLILFHGGWMQLPFEYYFRRYDLEREIRGVPWDLFESGELEPLMDEANIPRLQQLINGRDRVWLIYSHDWYTDPQRIVPLVLENKFELRNRYDLPGLKLFLYD